MNTKDRENLLKDLCARIPYGVKCQCLGRIGTVRSIDTFGNTEVESSSGSVVTDVTNVKPYLFPLSSMTREQRREYVQIANKCGTIASSQLAGMTIQDWFDKNYLDYRDFISKGWAENATGLNIY